MNANPKEMANASVRLSAEAVDLNSTPNKLCVPGSRLDFQIGMRAAALTGSQRHATTLGGPSGLPGLVGLTQSLCVW